MKFKLHSDSDEFLTCGSCGNDDFLLLPNKKLSADEKHKLFLFYECPNCAGAGFWTHDTTINKIQNFGIAIARCKPTAALEAGTI